MINVKVKGVKGERSCFFYVVAKDLYDAIELADKATLKGSKSLKKVDRITCLEVVDEDVILTKTLKKVWQKISLLQWTGYKLINN